MLITLLYYMSDLNVNEKDNELTSSCSVCCQYLLRLVHLIKKSRWVHIEYTQHYIDWSLYESKTMWLKSSLHIVSLYIYCLKNATSKAHYTWLVSINIASKHNLRSSLHIISLHFIDQTHWVYKHDFENSLHIISIHKYCLKNMTSEAHYT